VRKQAALLTGCFGILIFLVLSVAVSVDAQEGHPLVGTWHGTWGPTPAEQNDVTLVLDYDGKVITGMINPGPNSVKLQKASLEPGNWTVHFEADGKDRSGATVHYIIDGKIEDLGSVRRFIVGTWAQGTVKGSFKLTRDN
jgi:hypothetical protein